MASASVAKPESGSVCPSSVDVYDLLSKCRCMANPCLPSCSLTPACGGTSTDTAACDACVETSCGVEVLSCLARTTP
ncbi:hypothetical protein GF068_35535 [Polyangium spumosum]|uniref:Uncharacterized protein n=1 Tax=Polyangium spumosum TaxID=889282 RepID=A0A6N7Q2Z7_9BACT|nr:hypothetical protein [Polyangium spumosum]